MKSLIRSIIGGFLMLIGTLQILGINEVVGSNLVSGWSTPPGRWMTTVLELDLQGLFALAVVLTLGGLLILTVEYIRSFLRKKRHSSALPDRIKETKDVL